MLNELLNTLPQAGVVQWLGLRPGRRLPLTIVEQATASTESGLLGDRYSGKSGARHVTLIQFEHLPVIASLLCVDAVTPDQLRRNIAVSGINLLALKEKQFQIGTAILEYTGQCHPCSLMEETFGPGGYNAVRGHGGITAKVVQYGVIALKDPVTIIKTS